jgi:hypothetical protein
MLFSVTVLNNAIDVQDDMYHISGAFWKLRGDTGYIRGGICHVSRGRRRPRGTWHIPPEDVSRITPSDKKPQMCAISQGLEHPAVLYGLPVSGSARQITMPAKKNSMSTQIEWE